MGFISHSQLGIVGGNFELEINPKKTVFEEDYSC